MANKEVLTFKKTYLGLNWIRTHWKKWNNAYVRADEAKTSAGSVIISRSALVALSA